MNTVLQKDLKVIFGSLFDIEVNKASGVDLYKEIVLKNTSANRIINHWNNKEDQIYISNYLGSKLNKEYNKAFIHPDEVAISVLFWSLMKNSPKLAQLNFLYLSKHWIHLGWTRHVVRGEIFETV